MPAHRDDAERFAEKTLREGGCLIWTGARLGDGYGVFSVRHRTVRAHRWVLERHLGRPLGPGMFACHTCDNPPCVEVGHLYEGTHTQNMSDATLRDRTARGERSGTAVLREADVSAIRQAVAHGFTQAHVAGRYGVHQSTVSRIVSGARWARSA